jgi:sugar phosphate isomerase/epimerase
MFQIFHGQFHTLHLLVVLKKQKQRGGGYLALKISCFSFTSGSIGLVLPFPEACSMAAKHGFDAVNLDMPFLAAHGPAAVREELEKHGLKPGAFRFCVKLTDEVSDAEFDTALRQFETEVPQAMAAGYTRSAMHLLPWSCTDMPYGQHFRLTQRRLEAVAPILRETGLKVGLEFIGSYGLRRTRKFDFIHTIEGVRSLVAAAGVEAQVGLKLDSYHWYRTAAVVSLEIFFFFNNLVEHNCHLIFLHVFPIGGRPVPFWRTSSSSSRTRSKMDSNQRLCNCV